MVGLTKFKLLKTKHMYSIIALTSYPEDLSFLKNPLPVAVENLFGFFYKVTSTDPTVSISAAIAHWGLPPSFILCTELTFVAPVSDASEPQMDPLVQYLLDNNLLIDLT